MTRISWVRQEDPGGCGAATLAIILGCTYQQAKEQIDAQLWDSGGGEGPARKPPNWQEGGITQYHLDRALYEHGYFKQTRYTSWGYDITKPFAPVHWVIVRQPSNNHHFVVMQGDGSVLDPLHEQPRRLTDYPEVFQVCGLIQDATAVVEVTEEWLADVADADADCPSGHDLIVRIGARWDGGNYEARLKEALTQSTTEGKNT